MSTVTSTERTDGSTPIRVAVADDEETVVDVLRTLIGSDPTLRFVGSANDGWLTVWGDGPFPGAVSVNFLAGRVIGGLVRIVYSDPSAGAGAMFTPLVPSRFSAP